MSALLRQPGGFEGFGLVREQPPADEPLVAERPYLDVGSLERHAAALALAALAHLDNHVIARVDEFLRIGGVFSPGPPELATKTLDHLSPAASERSSGQLRVPPGVSSISSSSRLKKRVGSEVKAQRASSTFSRDIAYSVRPAIAKASARFGCEISRSTSPSRKCRT